MKTINEKKKINIKILILIIIIFLILKGKIYFKINKDLNKHYLKIQNEINLKFNHKIKNKIKIGIYTYSLKDGGLQRLTSLILKYFEKIKIYEIYLFTKVKKQKDEYPISNNITRIVITNPEIFNLINQTIINKIDILVYNFYNATEINMLNNLKNIKIIFYIHQSFLYWVYFDYNSFKSLYKAYQNSSYVISIVPFENDYLFKKWGIRSILMYNYISYEYDTIIPSNLSSKIIIMIGRAADKLKRFDLGIKAMEYIIKEVPDCQMKIISSYNKFSLIVKLVHKLNLENYIKFEGYSSKPEIYLKNASLHIFPSISEAFPMVLSETKIFGIPNILVGLDYLSMSNGGTIIIYDDRPESIANEAIKILKNHKYRKYLGKEARKSMEKFNNKFILKRWNQLILSIYNGDNYYQKLREQNKTISEKNAINILNNQLKLLKKRDKKFNKITVQDLLNFSKMEKLRKC